MASVYDWQPLYANALNARWGGFGIVGDGVADDGPAIAAAIGVLPADGGELYFPPGTYRVASTIEILNRHSVTLRGAGKRASQIVYGGPAGSPLLRLVNAREWLLTGLGLIGAQGANRPSALVQIHSNRDPVVFVPGTLAPTGMAFVDCLVGGDGSDMADHGIIYTCEAGTTPSSDQNNDLGRFERVDFRRITGAGIYTTHGQSKAHCAQDCSFSYGQWGVYCQYGSFARIAGGTAANCSVAVAQQDNVRDAFVLRDLNAEGCTRLAMISTFTTAQQVALVEGCRFDGSALNPDNGAIVINSPGPLTVRACVFQSNSSPVRHPQVQMFPNGAPGGHVGSLIVEGNAWPTPGSFEAVTVVPPTEGSSCYRIAGNVYRDQFNVQQGKPAAVQNM